MYNVRQKKIDEDYFLKKLRPEVLAPWPKTAAEIDLEEAVEYQKSLPDGKNFTKVLSKFKAERKVGLFPRSGVPVVENEIELLQKLNTVGVRLFPFTTDAYTRNLQLDKAQAGLEESIRTGKMRLNGYPIINHGVKTTRRVVESCEGAFDPRSSRVGNSFVGEVAFASGMTAMPNSFFGWIGGYDKGVTAEECISTAQYLGRLIGYYAERGVIISTDCHGWLPNGVVPMYMNIATQIIESLISAEQGVKSVVPLMNFQGNINQDLGDFMVAEKLFRKYHDAAGYDTIIPGLIANQSSLFPFPQDTGNAFGYINYVAMLAALAPDIAACSVKTIDEATGVPSIESHLETYRSANWIFNVVRQQEIELNTEEMQMEARMTELSVCAILDKVYELGDGDLAIGVCKAVEAGVLDSPFSISNAVRDLSLGARDLHGACRYIDYGNVPIPKEVREYCDEKIRERELKEGIKLNYNASIDDFWCLARGNVRGDTATKPKEDMSGKKELKRQHTLVTGTLGVDAHVIGTKILSRAFKEDGFKVIAMGAQTSQDDFIKAALETGAEALIVTSLYGMAEMDSQGFRDKCREAGLDNILMYIGSILGVGVHSFEDDKVKFEALGYDRVYPPESPVYKTILDLHEDFRKIEEEEGLWKE